MKLLPNGNYQIQNSNTGEIREVTPQDLPKYGLQVPNNAGTKSVAGLDVSGVTQSSPGRGFLNTIAEAAPTVGGIAGGIIGGATGVGAGILDSAGLGSIPEGLAGGAIGGSVGQGAGDALKQWIHQNLLNDQSQSGANVGEVAKNAGEGAFFGAGGAAVKGASLLPQVMGKDFLNTAANFATRGALGAGSSAGATAVGDIGTGKSDQQIISDIKDSAGAGLLLGQMNKGHVNLDNLKQEFIDTVSPKIEQGIKDAAQSTRFGISDTSRFPTDNVTFANKEGIISPKGFTPAGLQEEKQNVAGKIKDYSNQLDQTIGNTQINYEPVYEELKQILGSGIGADSYQARKLLNDFQNKSVSSSFSKQGLNGISNPQVSLKDVNDLKKQLGQFYDPKKDISDPINNAYLMLKDTVEKNAPDTEKVQELNQKLGQLQNIQDNLNGVQKVSANMTDRNIAKQVQNQLSQEYDDILSQVRAGDYGKLNAFQSLLNIATLPADLMGVKMKGLLGALGVNKAAGMLDNGIAEKQMNNQMKQGLIDAITKENGGQVPEALNKVSTIHPFIQQMLQRGKVNYNVTGNQPTQ